MFRFRLNPNKIMTENENEIKLAISMPWFLEVKY